MSIEANKAVIRRIVDEAWNGGDIALAAALVAPDFIDHNPAPGQRPDRGGFLQEMVNLRQTFAAAFSDFHVDLDEMVAEGDLVACRVAVHGTQTAPLWGVMAGTRPLPVTSMVFARIVNGQIAELWQEQNGELAWAAALQQERQRLARDLHDSVTQTIFSVSMLARAAQEQQDPAKVEQTLARVAALSQQALVEMRALLFELRSDAVAAEGLISALHKLVPAVQVRTELAVTLDAPTTVPVSAAVGEAAFRIVQESLNNVARHAHASAATVTVALSGSALLSIDIHDDGTGFDPEALPVPSGQGGMGLRSMRERAAAAGMLLRIESAPGQGTTIHIEAPTVATANVEE